MHKKQIDIYQLNIIIKQLEKCMCRQARKHLKMKQKSWRSVVLKKTMKTMKKIVRKNISAL